MPDLQSIEQRLDNIEDSIKKIELALIGNASLGHKGIVERINVLETVVDRHERRFLTWGSIVTALVFIVQLTFHYVVEWARGK